MFFSKYQPIYDEPGIAKHVWIHTS